MWSWFRRRQRRERERWMNHLGRLPDGDTVVPDGYRRWADLLGQDGLPLEGRDAFTGPTQQLPSVDPVSRPPLMTRAALWRSQGRGPRWT